MPSASPHCSWKRGAGDECEIAQAGGVELDGLPAVGQGLGAADGAGEAASFWSAGRVTRTE